MHLQTYNSSSIASIKELGADAAAALGKGLEQRPAPVGDVAEPTHDEEVPSSSTVNAMIPDVAAAPVPKQARRCDVGFLRPLPVAQAPCTVRSYFPDVPNFARRPFREKR
jgi:hypothetical protein